MRRTLSFLYALCMSTAVLSTSQAQEPLGQPTFRSYLPSPVLFSGESDEPGATISLQGTTPFEATVGETLDAINLEPFASVTGTTEFTVDDLLWSVLDEEALPPGVELDGSSLVGQPSAADSYEFEIIADHPDAEGPAQQVYTMRVNGVPTEFWVATLNGDEQTLGNAIEVASDGSIYVAGRSSVRSNDMLIVKYDMSGALLWERTLGHTSADDAYDIAIGPDGSIYVVGYVNTQTTKGAEIAIVKLDANGSVLWQTTLGGVAPTSGGSAVDRAHAIAIDTDGYLYISGFTFSSGQGLSDIFVAKYHSNGTMAWKKTIGTSGWDESYKIAIGPGGEIYLAGSHRAGPSATNNFLLVKLNADGIPQWRQTLGGSQGSEYAMGLAVSDDGSIYATGYTDSVRANDIIVAKYNASGQLLWHHLLGGSGSDIGYDIIIGTNDRIYVAATSASDAIGGNDDALILEYNASGDIQWSRRLGSTARDSVNGIAIGPDGVLHLTGRTSNKLLTARLPSLEGEEFAEAGAFVYQETSLEKWTTGWSSRNVNMTVGNGTQISENPAFTLIEGTPESPTVLHSFEISN